MKWPKFEQLINKRLSKRQAEVDVDALWAAIEPEVDAINRKKRRGLGWWWFPIGSGLLAAGLLAWSSYGASLQPKVSALPILLEGKDYAGLTEGNAQVQAAGAGTSRFESAKNGEQANAATRMEQLADELTDKAHAEEQRDHKKEYVAQIARPATLAKRESVNKEQQTGNDPSARTEAAILTNPPLPAELTVAEGAVAALPTLSLSVVRQAEDQVYFQEDSIAAAPPLIKPRQQFHFSVAVQGGAGMTQMKRSARSDIDESIALLELRNQRESLLEHTQAGLFFNLRHHSGLQLSSGLHYTQINERYDYQRSESVVIDSVYGPKTLFVNLYNEVDTIYGIVPIEEVTTHTKRYHNRHQLFEIPILLGYQRTVAHRLRLGVQAGGFLNISMRSEGRIARLPDSDIAINEAQAYRSNLGWSYYLGLMLEYQLTPRIHAYAAPSMRYFPGSFTQAGYPLEQAYRLYTVNVGVRYAW
jgi:hypothetical protein